MKIIFDTETTGLDPCWDEILQLSAIDENGNVLLNEYIKPSRRKKWDEAQRVNGISPAMVKNCPTMRKIRKKVQDIFSKAEELIAYNADFDVAFLEQAGITLPDVPVFDVMITFAEIYGERSDYFDDYKWQKLTRATKYYGYEFQAHNSLEYAKATLFIYNKMQGDNHNGKL